MGKQEEEKAVTEITVLTDEQIAELPKEAKKNVLVLTENMRNKELMVLNPLVTDLLDLKDRASKLTIERDEDGNITNIEEYKALKADQRTFNGRTTKEFKDMKKPYLAVQKGLVAVEKVLKDVSNTEVKEKAEETFKEYEEEKDRKAKEAQDAKDAELNEKINAATSAAENATKKAEQATVLNCIKYTEIAENITDKATNAVLEMNEQSLNKLKEEIAGKTFDGVTANYDISLLEEDVINELKIKFTQAKSKAVDLINDKLKGLQNEKVVNSYSGGISYGSPQSIPNPEPKDNGDVMELVQAEGSPYTIESLRAAGWADEQIISHGYGVMQKVASKYVEGADQSFESVQRVESPVIADGWIPGITNEVDLKRSTNEQFVEKIVAQLTTIQFAVEERIKEFGPTPELAELNIKLLNILE